MKKVLKTELSRCFCGFGFDAVMIFSIIIVTWYSIEKIPYAVLMNDELIGGGAGFLETSFTNWLFTRNMYTQSQIFYLIFPLLAAIPFGATLFSDKKNGCLKSFYIRTKKSNYLISKYITTFLSGGIAAAFPMILSFLEISAFLPSVKPEASYIFTNVVTADKWSELFFTKPMLYVLSYTLLNFVLFGLIACISLPITYVSYKSFLPIVFPFFFYIIESLLTELIGVENFSFRKIAETGTAGTGFSITAVMVILFAATFIPYYIVGMKEDIL
ncbi:MAG: hypothetical protein PUD24_06130 [Oscillospiraceae bacterium]|nr:hypothetical protein [Oscillospiraceae bacterium]